MAVTIKRKDHGMLMCGIDISTKTGLAFVHVSKDGLDIESTSEHTAQRDAGNIARADAISAQVISPINEMKPNIIMIEGYGYGNAHTLVTLAEVGTAIRLDLYRHGHTYNDVPPTTLKKFVTGKGNSPKDVMMKEVYKRWGFEGTDNECDAVGLAMFGAALYNAVDLPKPNLQAVEDWIKKNKKN